MFKLRRYLNSYKKQMILGPFSKLIEAVFELILPLLMARLIDIGVGNKDVNYVIRMSVYMIIASVIGFVCTLYCQYAASVASQGFGTAIRDALSKKINSLSHVEVEKFGASGLVNRSTIDVNQVQLAIAMFIRLIIRAPFLCIGGTIMAMMVDFKLALILLIFIPIFVIVLYVVMKKAIPLYKLVQKKVDYLSIILRENLLGVRVVRAFANSDKEIEKFDVATTQWMDVSMRAGKITALLSPITLLITNIATVCIVWFGGIRVNEGGLTQGELIAFINYITQIMLALIVVSNLLIIFTRASASASRINEVFEEETTIKSGDLIVKKDENNPPAVEFDNVSFGYVDGDKYSLKNISFKAQGGSTVGIIGGTGSGKSTLINLIPRFYDMSRGRILVDGIDTKDFELKSFRKTIGIVSQKVGLFSGTIRSNICFGEENASEKDIELASKTAQAFEFIEKSPQKFDSKVSQHGKNLSGGQRQRLTIARALVRKPSILILDDSSSALDYATDANLRKSIKENNNATTFIVSQRVNAVMNTDFIVVLNEGELSGTGTHEELLENNLLYQEICKSQDINGGEI